MKYSTGNRTNYIQFNCAVIKVLRFVLMCRPPLQKNPNAALNSKIKTETNQSLGGAQDHFNTSGKGGF